MAQVTRALVVEALHAPPAIDFLTARLTPWRGIGTPRGHASSPVGQRGAFLCMHQEDTMTAHTSYSYSPCSATPIVHPAPVSSGNDRSPLRIAAAASAWRERLWSEPSRLRGSA